jgi:hypothetical protein
MAITGSLQLAPGPATSQVADARRPTITHNHKSPGHQARATNESEHMMMACRRTGAAAQNNPSRAANRQPADRGGRP